jgi:plastocyanin
MARIRLTLAALAGGSLLLAVPATAGTAATPTLTGTDGPGFTITLKKGAVKVKTLKAGKYKIVIKDKSNIHNFHLIGPGVNKKTSVSAVTTVTWTVTLKKGTYRYICDPHASSMKGSFKVT